MAAPFRVLPALDEDNTFFWTAGAEGLLKFMRCQNCGYYLHPPIPQCPKCESKDIAAEAVSGRGVVHSFTINHHSWDGSTEPWSIVLVELDEQEGLRLTSNMINCANEDVRIGMPVSVVFEQHGEIYFPLFEPAS